MHLDLIREKETPKHELSAEAPRESPGELASPSENSEIIRSADLLKWEEVIRNTEPWRGPPVTMETGFTLQNLVIERRRDHSTQRNSVLASALSNLIMSCGIVFYGYYETHHVQIAKPGTVDGDAVMIMLQQIYSLVLMCKVMWAVGIIMVTLECEYATLKRIVLKSASALIIIVGLALLFTFYAGYMYGEGLDGNMLRLYVICLFMELVFPIFVHILLFA